MQRNKGGENTLTHTKLKKLCTVKRLGPSDHLLEKPLVEDVAFFMFCISSYRFTRPSYCTKEGNSGAKKKKKGNTSEKKKSSPKEVVERYVSFGGRGVLVSWSNSLQVPH